MGRLIALMWLSLALVACGYGGETAPYNPPRTESSASLRGEVLYARQCAWCHGSKGVGTTRGPNLNGPLDGGAYTHFMLSSGRMPLSSPLQRATRTTPKLNQTEIQALVSYVETFGGTGPPAADPDPTAGSVPAGMELYAENCAACHSSTGAGGALTSGEVAPPLDNPDVTSAQVAEAMAIGPGCASDDPACGPGSGAMPRFEFTKSEVNDIVAYVAHLQDQENRGGWSIGRLGPVAEGAVGWLVGLAAMLAVGMWIGTRVGERT